MSNHPAQRPRTGNDGSASPNGAAAVHTAGQAAGDITAQHLAGLQRILAQLPGMVANAVASALQQAPARSGWMCVQCLLARGQWEVDHMGELRAAHAMAVDAAGIAATDPGAAGLDLTQFLRPELLPGGAEQAPPQFDATVMVNGTGFCPAHTPGNPAAAAVGTGGGGLIRTPAGMNVHAAARVAMTAPGLPGLPGAVAEGMRS